MNIIILGAGQVGSTVATELAKEESNEITVIDTNQQILSDLQDRLDLRTICGNGSYPGLLEDAGADDADMLIALTNSDEINMIACQVASSLFHTPTKIARIRSPEYLRRPGLFAEDSIPVDVMISPESLVTDYIYHLIEHPSALQVLDFAEGRVQLVAVKAYHDGLMVGRALKTMNDVVPGIDMRVAAIFRQGESIQPSAECVIEAEDEVFFLAAREHIPTVISEMRKLEKPNKRIMLAGGGNIGTNAAPSGSNSSSRQSASGPSARDRSTGSPGGCNEPSSRRAASSSPKQHRSVAEDDRPEPYLRDRIHKKGGLADPQAHPSLP